MAADTTGGAVDRTYFRRRGRRHGRRLLTGVAFEAGNLVRFSVGARIGMRVVAGEAGESVAALDKAAAFHQAVGLKAVGHLRLVCLQVDVLYAAMTTGAQVIQVGRIQLL